MVAFESEHVILPSLPDGEPVRLVTGGRRLSYQYDERHVRPELLDLWAELGRHVRRSGVLTEAGSGPEIEVWLERVKDELLPLRNGATRIKRDDKKLTLEVLCRASLVSPSLIVQMNTLILPEACKTLGSFVSSPAKL